MKYLTFKEVKQRLTNHESFDMNDFIDAYVSKEIRIYLKHSGFIVKNSLDSDSKLINGFDIDHIKPFRDLVEPLDDITNQDVVALLQDKPITISYVTINDETYTLLRHKPTDLEFLDIESCAQLYSSSDLLIEKQNFERLFNTESLQDARSDRSIELENTKLLRIIGSILFGLDKSERYGDLSQNNLYDLMAKAVDLEKLRLRDKTVKNVFAQANDAVENYLIQTKK